MSKTNGTDVTYEPRELLDGELERAIGDILSAESEAKSIINKAQESVKAVQLDGAARERSMRLEASRAAAINKDKAINDANARADAECERLISAAKANGEALVKDKQKQIEAIAAELFRSLGGKK